MVWKVGAEGTALICIQSKSLEDISVLVSLEVHFSCAEPQKLTKEKRTAVDLDAITMCSECTDKPAFLNLAWCVHGKCPHIEFLSNV